MSRLAEMPAPNQDRGSLYAEITAKIVAELEEERVPWVQPWGTAGTASSLDLPNNAATGRRYSGINVLILWGAVIEGGYATQSWLTFRQAKALGATVRKGERGTTVVYASRFVPGEERGQPAAKPDGSRGIPFLKRFTVFNAEQCEGLPEDIGVPVAPPDLELILPQADRLIEASGLDFRIGGARAYYDPLHDYVQVPPPQAYFEPINWHRTAFHELAHSAGHHSRLKRDLTGAFGTKKYAQEELVAEIAAAYVCAALGIVPTVRHADYIGSWLELLRADDRAIVRAASAASKAADYLLAFLPEAARQAVIPDGRSHEVLAIGGEGSGSYRPWWRRPVTEESEAGLVCDRSEGRERGSRPARHGEFCYGKCSPENHAQPVNGHPVQQAGAEPVQCSPDQGGPVD